MLASKWGITIISVLISTGYAWNLFPTLTKTLIENFTRDKLARLRNQRNRLELRITNSDNATRSKQEEIISDNMLSSSSSSQNDAIPPASTALVNPNESGNSLNHSISRENLLQELQQRIPNKEEVLNKITEMGDKIVEFKEKMEPEVKKFLTEKYNSFLSNLVPYSETIGIPPYVLNSLKIPQNFDPRLQLIESMLQSVHMKTILNSIPEFGKVKRPEEPSAVNDVQGRSGDQHFLSDQEAPEGMGKGQSNKYHYHSSPSSKSTNYLFSDRSGYEMGYDNASPSESEVGDVLRNGYYIDDDSPYEPTASDLLADAGTHAARGHNGYSSRGGYGGGGYGHGGGGDGGNGLTDPFTILGGLAFLTYLAMLIQQQMANMPATNGRETLDVFDGENLSKAIPLLLAKFQNDKKLRDKFSKGQSQQRAGIFPILQDISYKSTANSTSTTTTSSVSSPPCSNLCVILRKLKSLHKLTALT